MSFPPTAANVARALALVPAIFTRLSEEDPDRVTHRTVRRALIAKLIDDGLDAEIEGVFEGTGEEAKKWKDLLRAEVERCVELQEQVSPLTVGRTRASAGRAHHPPSLLHPARTTDLVP